jgi:predicted nucleotidyltransferase component of viral defense system
MITSREIEAKANEFGLAPHEIEKDYVYGWLLSALYNRSSLRTSLVLKGGNGLRKAYLPNTRFSKDLDFSISSTIDKNALVNELARICAFVEQETGVHFFIERTIVKDKDLRIGFDALEARLYFKGFYREENLSLKAQLDVTQSDRVYLPIQERKLIHPYSDLDQCSATIRAQKIEEILASKLVAMLTRAKAADLFDLFVSIFLANDFAVDRLQVISTFLKRYTFERRPAAAREELLRLQLEELRPLWPAIVAPQGRRFAFDHVVSSFKSLIESMFALIETTGVSIRPTDLPGVGHLRAFASRSYFPSDVRNTILAAFRTHTMIELVYDGRQRVVQPYKIEHRLRQSDNTSHEYFWGYDTSGGRSGPGIKKFLCEKIESLQITNRPFLVRT